MSFQIAPEVPTNREVLALIAASDRYHAALYPAQSNHLVPPAAFMGSGRLFLVGRHNGVAVATGALIIADNEGVPWGEIKRMFLSPEMRGRGLGRLMLDSLEALARHHGLQYLKLETGIYQPEAITLYRTHGYDVIAPFGTYQEDPLSLFMAKQL